MSVAPCRIGPASFAWGRRTYVMGILNVTTDSFSGDGLADDRDAAVALAERLVADGADIVDVGGESTRPNAAPIDSATERARVAPVVARLAATLPVPISVDTSKPAVAAAALAAGASIINDVHGLRGDPAMARVAARHGATVVAMANLRGVSYRDVVAAVREQFRRSLAIAAAAGLAPERVILDPGFGFGPTPAENLELVRRLDAVRLPAHPLLLGPSRKSTIGAVLGLPVHERVEGTAAVVAIAIDRGVDIVRVHDVRAIARVARMTDAIVRGGALPQRGRPTAEIPARA
ncbi:MAG: dihydropteroate synthase [Dehalococcoidia bacterium]